MRLNKIFVFMIIISLAIVIIPQAGVSDSIDPSFDSNQSSIGPNQIANRQAAGPPALSTINASIPQVTRNITVQRTSNVVLDDQITLDIHGNTTELGMLNYSIPTVFAQYVEKITFYSQFNEKIGLEDAANKKSYSVYEGDDVTTYFIDITQNNTRANQSTRVFVQTSMIAVNALDVELNGTGQRGVFTAPLVPMFSNLEVENAEIGYEVLSTQDQFLVDEIKEIPNKLDETMPVPSSSNKVLSFENMTRTYQGLGDFNPETDQIELFFASSTPVGDSAGSTPTTIVPSAFKEANRKVVIQPWNKVYVTEEITILHLGGKRNTTERVFQNIHQLSGQIFRISNDATLTDIYDSIGTLALGDREEDTGYINTVASEIRGKDQFRIDFRNPIYGGETYTFTVEYEYNLSDVITSEGGTHTFNTSLFSDYNTSVYDMNVQFFLPSGSTLESHDYQFRSRDIQFSENAYIARKSFSAQRNVVLEFNIQNASFVDNDGFQIVYNSSPIGYFDYMITFFATIILFLGFLYLISGIKIKSPEQLKAEREKIPVDEIEVFFNLFSEKTGAEKRLAELRKKRKKGKLSKKDYQGQVKAIRRRLRDLNPELEKAAKDLSSEGGKYENLVNKVMLASQKQVDTRRNARLTQQRYTRKEISKNIYQRLMREYNQELSKYESIINKNLTELYEISSRYR